MTAIDIRRRETTLGMFDAVDPLPIDLPQTPINFAGHPALAGVFREGGWTLGVTDSSDRRNYMTFFLGDGDMDLVWSGTGRFVLGAVDNLAGQWSVTPTDRTVHVTEVSIVDQVIDGVEWMTSALGLTERDVLASAGISDRTYYSWKRYRKTTPRRGSQAQLWALMRSVRDIAGALDEKAPAWMKSDPTLRGLLLEGGHGKLAALAMRAAATEWGVVVPADNDDRLGTNDARGIGQEADDDGAQLKHFRTAYPVTFTHNEYGDRLVETTGLEAAFYDEEAEDDVVLIDLDD